MLDQIKLFLFIVLAMLETMPQETVDPSGAKSKIPDENYVNLIGDGIGTMVIASGFQIAGITESQLRGSVKGFVSLARAWKMAPRVAL